MFATAMRLVSNRPPPDDVQRAVSLLEEALAKGYAKAGVRLAAYHAMAANATGDPRQWELAFDFLERAAEQGSATAGRQLLLLADNSQVGLGAPQEDGHWHEVRSRIRIERLLAPQVRRSLSESPRIRVIEGFATAAECRWVVERARKHLAPATVFDPTSGELILDPARDNAAVSLMFEQMDVVSEVLRTRISAVTHVPVAAFEPPQILRYEIGQQFIPHYDFMDANSAGFREKLGSYGQRIATFLIYLNEGFEGGETNFPKIGLSYRGRTGDAIFWANLDTAGRPDPLTLHAGLPPTSGEKWVFSQWIREKTAPAIP
jgi:prolyl 4-hydroxylase